MSETQNTKCKQPDWKGIIEQCQEKIKRKYPEYGNSWINMDLDDRLQQEFKEYFDIPDSFDWKQKISELEDVINVCAMMITNYSNEEQDGTSVSQESKN